MATTNGKGTTPTARFISLAKEVRDAHNGVVSAWLAVYKEYKVGKWANLSVFSEAFVQANKGTANDIWTANTVRVSLTHIKWAEDNIKGGAKVCESMAHIIASKKGGAKPKAKPSFVAEKEAMRYSVKQLEAMLAFRKAAMKG